MDFVPFQKLSRLSRDVVITEKLDGTNASITIDPTNYDGNPKGSLGFYQTDTGPYHFFAGSRTRFIVPGDDNYGFAKWVQSNMEELVKLGPGTHFGEWWGQGIQRNYSLTEKRFSLFNTHRWGESRPACCHVVPVLYSGPLEEYGVLKGVKAAIKQLTEQGSVAAPGFMDPEGIVIFHTASNEMFKKTLKDDEVPKSVAEKRQKELVS